MCLATWQLCVNCNKRIQTTAQPRPVRWPWLGAARRYVLELLAICLCCEWQQWREQCRHSLLIRRNTPSLCNNLIVPLLIRTTRHTHEVWRAAGQQTGDCIRVGTLGTIISYSYEQQHCVTITTHKSADLVCGARAQNQATKLFWFFCEDDGYNETFSAAKW